MVQKIKNHLIGDILWITLSFLLVLTKAISNSITGDELSTLSIITDLNYSEIISHKYTFDFNPPLYFVVTKFFYNLIPTNLGFRFVSVVSFLLNQLILSSMIKRKKNLFSLIIYFNPLMIYFGSYSRSYMLSILFVIAIYHYSRNLYSQSRFRIHYFIILSSLISVGFWINYLIGIYTAFLFLLTLLTERIKKIFISRLIILLGLCIPILIFESQFILNYTSTLSDIKQDQSTFGFLYQFLYICYGLIFGETFAPAHELVLILPTLLLISGIYLFRVPGWKLSKKSLKLILLSFLTISLTSLSNFGRPMYVFYLLPFIPIVLENINSSVDKRKFIPLSATLGLIYSISNFNYMTSNSIYYFSPVSTIEYDEIFKSWEDDNTLLIVSPSYNIHNYKRFHNSNTKNTIFIDHFDESRKELIINELKMKLTEFDKATFIHEKPNQFIEDIHNVITKEYYLSAKECKEHKSIISGLQYCYISFNNYEKK